MEHVVKKPATSEPFKPLISANWSRTQCEIEKVDFEWNISMPFEFFDNLIGSLSTTFSPSKRNPRSKWNLTFSDDGPDFKILWDLHASIDSYPALLDDPIRTKVSIVNIKREKLFPKVTCLTKNSKGPFEILRVGKQALNGSGCFQIDGSFTIFFEIETCFVKETGSGESSLGPSSNAQSSLSAHVDMQIQVPTKPKRVRRRKKKNSLEGLFRKMKLSDVTLVVGGREFDVHKTVIAFRSPVLAALFQSSGESSNRVEVKDVDADVFQELLRFIYTGKVPFETMEKKTIDGMYDAAMNYELDDLVNECFDYKMSLSFANRIS